MPVACDSIRNDSPCWTTRSTGISFVALPTMTSLALAPASRVILERERHVTRVAAQLELADPAVFEVAFDGSASRRRFDVRFPVLREREFRDVACLAHLAAHVIERDQMRAESRRSLRRAAEHAAEVERHGGVGRDDVRQRRALDAETGNHDRARPRAAAALREIDDQSATHCRGSRPGLPIALVGKAQRLKTHRESQATQARKTNDAIDAWRTIFSPAGDESRNRTQRGIRPAPARQGAVHGDEACRAATACAPRLSLRPAV